jgi:hypothetical protein
MLEQALIKTVLEVLTVLGILSAGILIVTFLYVAACLGLDHWDEKAAEKFAAEREERKGAIERTARPSQTRDWEWPKKYKAESHAEPHSKSHVGLDHRKDDAA